MLKSKIHETKVSGVKYTEQNTKSKIHETKSLSGTRTALLNFRQPLLSALTSASLASASLAFASPAHARLAGSTTCRNSIMHVQS